MIPECSHVDNFLRSSLSIGLIIFCLVVSGDGQGQEDRSAPVLKLVGLDGLPHQVTAEDWGKLPRASVKAKDHGGAIVGFEGVPARELLKIS